ncbi:MAG: peptide deformylase [Candidatus Omnitrophica bacterium]|nr:peptide deformylase [Candidatus Omnitrophota bacterium]
MAVLKLSVYPASVLAQTAKEVTEITEVEERLIEDMIETMYAARGVGLAAPQVGISKKIIVCSPETKKGSEYVFINPEIISVEGEERDYEGCLSLPGAAGNIKRAKKVTFRARDRNMKPVKMTVSGLFARIIQHELDHLDGRLILDRAGFSERQSMIDSFRQGK